MAHDPHPPILAVFCVLIARMGGRFRGAFRPKLLTPQQLMDPLLELLFLEQSWPRGKGGLAPEEEPN